MAGEGRRDALDPYTQKPVSFRESQWALIDEQAEARGLSRAAFVRNTVLGALNRERSEWRRAEVKE